MRDPGNEVGVSFNQPVTKLKSVMIRLLCAFSFLAMQQNLGPLANGDLPLSSQSQTQDYICTFVPMDVPLREDLALLFVQSGR